MLLLLLSLCRTLGAQEFRATLTGVVTDESGAVMGKADVLAINNATQQTYKATTTRQGTYYIPYVIPGTYTVKVSFNGFNTEVQDDVLVQASEYRGLNFTLHVGSVTQDVTVTDAPPLLNTANGSGGTIISQQELESAPLNGREVYSLLGTTPSTQFTTTNVSSTSSNSYNVTNSYVVGGGVSGYQQFSLNGTNITEQSTGGAGSWEFAPNIDALQEVNVMTSTYDARYGRTGNGTVNMVVKNGTNRFHGNMYEYLENSVFNANNFEDNMTGIARQGMHQNQFGATLGGPVVKDKVFFFASYEGFRQSHADTTLTSTPPAYLRPTSGGDVNFTASGFTVYDPTTTYCTTGGRLGNCAGGTYALTRNSVKGINDGFDVGDMLLGNPGSSNSEVQWNPQTFTYYPAWDVYFQDDWRALKSLTLNLGIRYDVQVGARARGNAINRGMCLTCVNPVGSNSTYQANLATDAAALAAAGIDTANLSTVYGGIEFAGANGQPSTAYNTQWNNIAPRLGFAWQIDPLTVIRGGYGIMYSFGLENGTYSGFDETTNYDASNNGGLTSSGYFASGTPFPSGAQQPAGASGGLLTGIGNTQSLDFPQRKIPYSHMASLGFQRALPDQTTLDVRYSGNFAYHLRTSTTLNAVSREQLDEAIANPNYFDRQVPNPYYGVLPATSTIGSSPTIKALTLMQPYSEFGQIQWDAAPVGRNLYDALEVKLNKRMGGPEQLAFQLSYTWSKTMTGNSYQNSYPYEDPTVKYEIGSYDRTNILALTDQWFLPIGKGQRFFNSPNRIAGAVINQWQFSSILSAEGGFPVSLNTSYYDDCNHPFTPEGGTSLSHYLYNDYSSNSSTGCYATIPEYQLKNLPDRISSVRQPTAPNLDASLQKTFALTEGYNLTFRADAFNLTNSVLFPGPDNNPADGPPVRGATGSYTGFGTVALNQQNVPRVLQFALKLAF
jgi:hypothetical protein